MKDNIILPNYCFYFDHKVSKFNQNPARANRRQQTEILLISASLEMRRIWKSAWISVVETMLASWPFFRADSTALVCHVTDLNSVIKYWITC